MHTTPDGFVTADDTEFMAEVARLLNGKDPSLDASVWHTGGGIFCISMDLKDIGRNLCWGTADAVWACDVNDLDGDHLDETLRSEASSESKDAQAVADAMFAAIEDYRTSLAGRRN
jgi:hypothetical protein